MVSKLSSKLTQQIWLDRAAVTLTKYQIFRLNIDQPTEYTGG